MFSQGHLVSFVAVLAIATHFTEAKPSISIPHFQLSPFLEDSDPSVSKPVSLNTTQNNAAEFQAFISYRRAPSRNLAMLIKVMMERENVSVFLDVEDLEGGPWDPQLIKGIDESPNFILVLSNGTLDRARGDVNYTDFMHNEIREAVVNDKRIILVFDDYDFPPATDFSPEIQTALQNQGLTWQHALVDQCLERLLSYMREPVPFNTDQKNRQLSRHI